jgi:ERCC4-type nuclease
MDAVIWIDTREQDLHILKKLDAVGIKYKRKKLDYGDYSFQVNGESFEKRIVVERKGSITELCGNFAKGKTRFQKEFERAFFDKCKVVLMVEDGSWEKIENGEYRSRFSPGELKSRIKTWCNKFQIELKFVEKDKACSFILDCFMDYVKAHTPN